MSPAQPRCQASPTASSALAHPQERVAALDAQAAQIRLQSAQEAERLAQERNDVLRLLQKVRLTSRARGLSHTPWSCMLATWVPERAKCS